MRHKPRTQAMCLELPLRKLDAKAIQRGLTQHEPRHERLRVDLLLLEARSHALQLGLSAPQGLIIRLGLESELKKTRAWPESLKTEPEKDLRKLGERLGTIVKDGDAALEARRTAVASTADHRVREIVTLIDDVNNARLSMYGILVQRAVDLRLPKDWPNRFFRRTQREPRIAPPVTPPVPLT